MSKDSVLVWCLGLSRAQSLPRREHRSGRPTSAPPLDGPGLLPTKVAPLSFSGVANSLRRRPRWGGHQDRPAGCLDAETIQPQVASSSGHCDLHHRALGPILHLHPPSTLVSSPGVMGGFGVPHLGHPGSACPNSSQHPPLSLPFSPTGPTGPGLPQEPFHSSPWKCPLWALGTPR